MKSLLSALIALLLCSACMPLVSKRSEMQIYRLQPAQLDVRREAAMDVRLLIDEPLAAQALDGDRIVVFPKPNTLQFYGGARWAVRIPLLIQDHLVEMFEQSGALAEARRISGAAGGDFALTGELRDFQAVYASPGQAPQVRVRLQMHLLDQGSNRVLASREFLQLGSPESEKVIDVVAALDSRLKAVLADVVAWALVEVASRQAADESTSQASK